MGDRSESAGVVIFKNLYQHYPSSDIESDTAMPYR